MKLLKTSTTNAAAGIYLRQMAAMVGAGVPIGEAIATLAQQEPGGERLARINIKDDSGGQDLFKRIISYLEHNRQPDRRIAEILYKVADEIDKYREFKIALGQILFIPVSTLLIAAFMVAIMMVYVVPVWETFFVNTSRALPAPTLLVLKLSDMLTGNIHIGVLVLPALVLIITLIFIARKALFSLFSRFPLVRQLFMHQSMVRFTRFLSVLLHIDTPLKEAAAIAVREVRNPVYARKIEQAVSGITESRPLNQCLYEEGLVTTIVGRIIATGQRSGTLAQTLNDVAVLYEKEADIALSRTIYWLDLFIKLTVGVIIGTILIAMYLPIFNVAGGI